MTALCRRERGKNWRNSRIKQRRNRQSPGRFSGSEVRALDGPPTPTGTSNALGSARFSLISRSTFRGRNRTLFTRVPARPKNTNRSNQRVPTARMPTALCIRAHDTLCDSSRGASRRRVEGSPHERRRTRAPAEGADEPCDRDSQRSARHKAGKVITTLPRLKGEKSRLELHATHA